MNVQEFVNSVVDNLQDIILSLNPILGIILGMLVIVTESMIPVLPLGVFITFNVLVFGNVLGFAMSWVATVIGCSLMFLLVRRFFQSYFRDKIKKNKKLKKIMERLDDISFSNLVLITSLPFTPAFLVNIASGLSKMDFKKFFLHILISKFVIVYFWAYIGSTFVKSVTDIFVIIRLSLLLIFAFILSKIVMKKQKID